MNSIKLSKMIFWTNSNIIGLIIISILLMYSPIQAATIQNNPTSQTACEGDTADTVASWAPDGKQILFVSERTGNPDIWIMDENGEHPTNLTADNDSLDFNPVWSPDGKQIAFLSNREKIQIYG